MISNRLSHPPPTRQAVRAVQVGILANCALAAIKIITGLIGHSYALIADGIESINDVLSSVVALIGIKVAQKPADDDHPYGHGKAEQLATLFLALSLLAAGAVIAWQSLQNLQHSRPSPHWVTLPVLLLVIVVKLALSRFAHRKSQETLSSALRGDAWHHQADAITSAAALIGVSIAILGGEGYEKADNIAALLACLVIGFNGTRLLLSAVHENMDGAAAEPLYAKAREIASSVHGVAMIEKLRIKKSGLGYHMDIHVQVDPAISVADGHLIGHAVQDALYASDKPFHDVIVHVEPYEPENTTAFIS
jgi:cation diffusion facilitator family transporter